MKKRNTINTAAGSCTLLLAAIGLTALTAPASAAPAPSPGAHLSIVARDIVNPEYSRVMMRFSSAPSSSTPTAAAGSTPPT